MCVCVAIEKNGPLPELATEPAKPYSLWLLYYSLFLEQKSHILRRIAGETETEEEEK